MGRKVITIAAPIAIACLAVPKVLGIVIGASATLPKVVTHIRLPLLDDYDVFLTITKKKLPLANNVK